MREMNQNDYGDLAEILQNPKVMYAYEHDFSDNDVQEWLDRQVERYKKYGFGLWAVILMNTGEMIGQAGLTIQPYKDKEVLEIGYLLKESFWHNGYASEAASGCKRYAFEQLNRDKVYSIIKSDNHSSMKVAESIGMKKKKMNLSHNTIMSICLIFCILFIDKSQFVGLKLLVEQKKRMLLTTPTHLECVIKEVLHEPSGRA